MKKLYSIKAFVLSVVLLFNSQSCADLDEDLYSTVTNDTFFQTEEEFISALGGAYADLYPYMTNEHLFPLNEVTTDELTVPTRGTDWDDNGAWRRLHTHTYTPLDAQVTNGWSFVYRGINDCNRLILQFENIESDEIESAPYIAELKALRALFYWHAMDLYGNVPIVDRFDTPPGFLPETSSRKEVFDFIVKDLNDNVGLLKQENDATTYGRMNYWAGKALLAKLYLNAEVYIGQPMLSEALAACNEIINSGKFSLAADYYANFNTDNQGSPEFILAIPYDEINARGFNMGQMTGHYVTQATFNLAEQPWNGFCTIEDFYNSYEEDDVRRANFLVGPQLTSTGLPAEDNGVEARDPDGAQVNFTPKITSLTNALRQEGARIVKWEIALGALANLSNDFAIFRFTDILLMKAEILHRQTPGNGEALALVNQIRERAGVDGFDVLTDENLLAERGREMFAEVSRRQDLIRFGQYNKSWWEKPASDPTKNIFPIPETQINNNPNLIQNPGY